MERGSIKKTSEEESSKVIPPAPTRRQNPYAKRKPPPLNSQSSTGASFSEPATAPKSLPINNTRIRNTNLPAQSNVCDFGLVGTVEAQAITFSQAFGDEGESGKRDSGHKFNTRQGGRSGGSSGKPLAACVRRSHDAPPSSLFTSSTVTDAVSARDNHSFIPTDTHVLYVSTRQRGNKVLEYIRNVPFDYATMVPDYLMAYDKCALFLSLKYHRLKGPDYIQTRIQELRNNFKVRVLLVLVDISDNEAILSYLNHLAVLQDFSLLLAFSEEEAARYLETLKVSESRNPRESFQSIPVCAANLSCASDNIFGNTGIYVHSKGFRGEGCYHYPKKGKRYLSGTGRRRACSRAQC
mmetsp:Transcript_43349/g.101690  ORF Transcript_43349/g.101690 Transcript_43349/m.101690 type:complete len:352 (-) Transcript_43349:314-1369(-)